MKVESIAHYTAVVLAAHRNQPNDPLADHCDNGNKNFIKIEGRPMIAWVIRALLDAPEIKRVIVSVEDLALMETLTEFAAETSQGRLHAVESHANLYESVSGALAEDPLITPPQGNQNPYPALITTGDNPLVTPEMISHFINQLQNTNANAAIAMTPADVMRAKYPDGQRRFYRFRNGEYSNCNLYAITQPSALTAAEAFRSGGQFRKKFSRIFRAFGPMAFALYFLRQLSLESAGQRISKGFGVRLRFIEMPFAEACIDVDNERSLRIAQQILAHRVAA